MQTTDFEAAVAAEIEAEKAKIIASEEAEREAARHAQARVRAEARVRQREITESRARVLGRRQAKMDELDAWVRDALREGPRHRDALLQAARDDELVIGGGDHEVTYRGTLSRLGVVGVHSHLHAGTHLALPGQYGLEWTTKQREATDEEYRKRLDRQRHNNRSALRFLAGVLEAGPIEASYLERIARSHGFDVGDPEYLAAFERLDLLTEDRASDATSWVRRHDQRSVA